MAYESDPVFQEPQCLIKTDGEGKLEVVEAVLKQISKISKPLNIVAIVGPSRSGKSYLLNRLAQRCKETVSSTSTAEATTLTPSTTSAEEICTRQTTSSSASRGTQQATITSATSATPTSTFIPSQTSTSSSSTTTSMPGFQLGSTSEAVTQGIWVWCLPHPIRTDEVLMLLDTEGIGDVTKSDRKHDNWIFVTATLLASTLVYNIKGVFSIESLETWSLITEMSRYVMISESNNDDSNLDIYMPHFIVSVRDAYMTPSTEGKTLTSHEYLEDVVLSCHPGKTQSNKTYNTQRLCIRKYFKTRTCFFFGIPATPSRDVNRLGELPADKLDGEYVLEENKFTHYVFSECGPKLVITGEKVNGVFATMTQDYVLATRNDSALCIEAALSTMATTQNKKAVEACVRLYSDNMGKELQLPVSDDKILSDRHNRCTKDAIALFLQMAVNDKNQDYQNMANEGFLNEYKKILKRNKKESESRCQTILENLANAMDQNIRENKYKQKGGYDQYQQDLSDIKREYNKRVDLGCMQTNTLLKFVEDRLVEGRNIFNEEKHITELDREKELTALNVQKNEMISSQMKMRRMLDDMNQQLKENEEQWKKRTEEKVKEAKQHLETKHQASLREQERLMKENHEEESKELKKRNDKLHTFISQILNPVHKWFPARATGWLFRLFYGDVKVECNDNVSEVPKVLS